ncbi:MAG: YcxB family protein [Fibrobacter sp.]|nr:YcxB family protein [Fibrobacter sp.]
MKRLTGWILIVFCSILLLIFAFVLVTVVQGVIFKGAEIQMTLKEIISSILGFIIVISLLLIGLKNGVNRVKKEKVLKIKEYTKDLNIELTGIIEYTDYRNLILGLSFKKPIYLVVVGTMLLLLLSFLVNSENMTNQFGSNYILLIFIGIFLFSPFLTLVNIKRQYDTSRILQEKFKYYLTNESIRIKSETLDSVQKWEHFDQVRETKRFFLFYHGKTITTILDKRMFSEKDLQEFHIFTKSLK